jgi:hypothetical protein
MRADLTDPDVPDWRKYLFTCEADDHHFLLFEWWDDDPNEDYPGTLDVIPSTYAPTFRQRVVTAVKVLFGRRVWTTDCVLLDEPTTIQLRQTIDLYLANEKAKRDTKDTDTGHRGWMRGPK